MGQGGRGGHGEACGRGVRGPAFGGDVAGEVAVRFGRGSSTPHSRNHPPGNVARGVAPQFPAGIDAPALEKTIRPPRSCDVVATYPGRGGHPPDPSKSRVQLHRPPPFWSHLTAGSLDVALPTVPRGGLPDPSFLDQGWIAPPPRVQAMVTACVQLRGTWAASALSLSKGGTEGRVSLGA